MARKQKETKKLQEQQSALSIKKKDAVMLAEGYANPIRTSAFTAHSLHKGAPDIATLRNEFEKQINQVLGGDISVLEKMLMSQALSLSVMYNRMASISGVTDTLEQRQAYCDIAMKAQNQCRKALLALVELKNPKRATFIKQQNIGVNQQVNNSEKAENPKNISKPSNQLLNEAVHEALDFRGTKKAVGSYSSVETVEAFDRR